MPRPNAAEIGQESLSGIDDDFKLTLCRVERSTAQSRHLAADRMCPSFAAGFLRSGLRPPVEKTNGNNESQSATEFQPHPLSPRRKKRAGHSDDTGPAHKKDFIMYHPATMFDIAGTIPYLASASAVTGQHPVSCFSAQQGLGQSFGQGCPQQSCGGS